MEEGKSPDSRVPHPHTPIEPGSRTDQPARGPAAPVGKKSRANLVFFLGILCLLCCPPLGILAWIMGSSDLRQIRAGRMSSDNLGILKVGWVLGMVGTGVTVLAVIFGVNVVRRLPDSFSLWEGSLRQKLEELKKNREADSKAGPLTRDQLTYVGEWVGEKGSMIRIHPNGTGDCAYQQGSFRTQKRGGRVRIQEGRLSIGFFGIDTTWRIDKAPSMEDGRWTMILEGETFVRVRTIEIPPSRGGQIQVRQDPPGVPIMTLWRFSARDKELPCTPYRSPIWTAMPSTICRTLQTADPERRTYASAENMTA